VGAALDTALVVSTGKELVGARGWGALSLRAVAQSLGVTPMALYRHVSDGDTLRRTVLDAIVGESPAVRVEPDLGAALAEWARRFHRHLLRFPGAAGALLVSWFDCTPMLERIDDLLAMAIADGMEGADAVAATNAVFTYVLLRAEAERHVRSAGAVRRRLRTAAATRPLVHLAALASHYTTAQFDTHFEYGLRALIDGMHSGARA
jgi:AcrR family transcriptional regulator